ncbi:DUF4376 domain-containing protein [Enterobacter hormaechei]|uniref:DUF4376 domain-containing protein n=1 Tax=Enterobacter hormaechei TaxID=158836 RepID=UPI0007B3D175|nr:DUF4376 domain-containing protein [Enterobacter hormaechei]KZP84553.1 phage tail protein [Enterobacter hormaechei subsp. xiangfangensis]RTM57078.1 DUF4376 domain-containing protein [Enterobacter hormaechei subsp. xiangfangensis]
MNTFEFSNEPRQYHTFNFSADTHEYLGESDTLVEANTGLPAYCTLIQPPECPDGHALVFNDEGWQAIEDHRGKVVTDKNTGMESVITELGPLPETVTTAPRDNVFTKWDGEQWLPDLEAAKEFQIAKIKSCRDNLSADHIVIDGLHFHSDTSSRIQQMTLTKMGKAGEIPAGLMWQTKNAGLVELTNEIASQFEEVTMAHDMRLFANALQHIAAVNAMEDVNDILAYDYSEGWQP